MVVPWLDLKNFYESISDKLIEEAQNSTSLQVDLIMNYNSSQFQETLVGLQLQNSISFEKIITR